MPGIALGVAVAAVVLFATTGDRRPAPNVVFILLDDLGMYDVGAYGGAVAPTPNLDSLAADGMLFTNAYASGPVCSPTRAALLTGRHPGEFGIRRAIVNDSVRGIPSDTATLPAVLSDHGYVTGHFGKWHLGWNHPDYLPSAKGFDEAVLVASDPPDYRASEFLVDGIEPIARSSHLTAATVDLAIEFIERHHDEPFYVNVWLNAPHTPLDPPDEWAARFPESREGRYAALVADADEEIGRLVARIDALGISEDTIVIVTSDNGGTHPEFGSNGDYRGEKTSVFEGALRVPMILRWPGTVTAGTSSDALVLSWDVFPTVADIAAIDVADLALPGRSFRAILEGVGLPGLAEPVVWENKYSNDYFESPSGRLNNFAVRDGSWKLVFDDNATSLRPMLFDLSHDPFERDDLADEHPDIVARLEAFYLEWRLSTGRIDTAFDTSVIDLGSSVEIADHGRLDTHDGDFTFRVVLHGASMPDGTAPIASKAGAWSLQLTDGGILRLVVTGSDGRDHELASRPLPQGPVPIAFTVYGRRNAPATVTLFVDDRPVADVTGPPMVHPGRNPVVLGGPGSTGSLSGLYLSQSALSGEELTELTRRAGA